MRALLDVNVLLALVDPEHVHHETVHAWIDEGLAGNGWATCAVTQNGFLRIISQPSYSNSVTLVSAFDLLRGAVSDPAHEFWPCDVRVSTGKWCAHAR